ncbi:MAG: hypothetical protein RBT73_03660, partial [Spirochaetia bacterium]|nr:hypothetical protein [Spirochaetia bacterium]
MNRSPGISDSPSDGPIFTEHPNPSWARRSWISLDGLWDFSWGPEPWMAYVGDAWKGFAGRPRSEKSKVQEREQLPQQQRQQPREQILVPFPIGSEASGVITKDKGVWLYSRTFFLTDKPGRRWILHVGACDYEARIFVNTREMAVHRGGYSSFSVDISDASKAGKNSLEILVKDSRSPFQVRGKQSFLPVPFLVWYSGCSGIWQSIWIEETGDQSLAGARLEPDFDRALVRGRAWLDSDAWRLKGRPGEPSGSAEAMPSPEAPLRLEVCLRHPDGSQTCLTASGPDREGCFFFQVGFDVVGGAFWSPENPILHPIVYRLLRGTEILDQVESYFGLRKIGLCGGKFLLNDEALYLRFVLIQGYYPGASYAAPSREAMEKDILAAKAMGFNGARIHQKVESPYFQYLCDRLGFLASFEMPSFYLPSRRAFVDYEAELRSLIARDMIHPSCVLRILFNETWGIWGIYGRKSQTRRFVLEMVALAQALDPTRPVIDNSGWEHLTGDMIDIHHYFKSPSLAKAFYEAVKSRDPTVLHGFSVSKVLAFNLLYQVATKTRSLFVDRDAQIGDRPLFLSEYGGFGWYKSEGKAETIDRIREYTKDALDSGIF